MVIVYRLLLAAARFNAHQNVSAISFNRIFVRMIQANFYIDRHSWLYSAVSDSVLDSDFVTFSHKLAKLSNHLSLLSLAISSLQKSATVHIIVKASCFLSRVVIGTGQNGQWRVVMALAFLEVTAAASVGSRFCCVCPVGIKN